MKRFVRRSPLIGLGLALGLVAGVAVERYRVQDANRAVTTAQVFQDVLAAIRERYVDSLSDEELYAKAAKGVVSTLGDPYSAFLGAEEYHAYRDLLTGHGRSIGVTVEQGLTGLRIRSVVPRSPADRSGIEPGDYLLGIDDQPALQLAPAKAAALLRRPDETPVRVRFRTPGDSVAVEVSLTPALGRLPAALVPVKLADSVGYLALSSVSENSSRELREALATLDLPDRSTLVLDLRGNAGGPLDEALTIANLFLDPGKRIGAVSKRKSLWATYASRGPDYYPNLALTILVDRRTASSAEIIAAALRDNDRARLIGERTFGKGLIQTTVPLGEGAALRLTTGRWQGPGGRLIAGGILPDSVVVLDPGDALLRRALERAPDAVAAQLDEAVRGVDPTVAIDSIAFTPDQSDRLRQGLRPAGIQLSRRFFGRHHRLFDLELRRVAAARRGDADQAVRFALLTDPVVAAAMARIGRKP